MHKEILLNKNLSFEKRFRRYVVYLFLRFKAWRGWKKRHNKAFSSYSNLKKKDSKKAEKKHKEIWKSFRRSVDMSTYRMSKNISGISNPYVVPEEIFFTDIQETLNIYDERKFLEIKSFYNEWYPLELFPKDFFHNVDGVNLNGELNIITVQERDNIINNLSFPVVLKPNIHSNGGEGVSLIKSTEELKSKVKGKNNYLVQEVIEQHPFFNKFSPDSSNTIRVFLYRSVKDNDIHILSMAMKMGRRGQFTDNVSETGLVSYIKKNGELNNFALNKFGGKYFTHPDTKVKIEGRIPNFDELKKFSISIAQRLFYSRIIGLDVTLDSEGKWKVIEINLGTQSIRFSQYAGQPFFGEFTEEVIEYCKIYHWTKRREG